MTMTPSYILICDYCERAEFRCSADVQTEEDAIKEACKEGWAISIGDRIFCPNCNLMNYVFHLHINMGNPAMKTIEDIAEALERVAKEIRRDQAVNSAILDRNGNHVGEFGLVGRT